MLGAILGGLSSGWLITCPYLSQMAIDRLFAAGSIIDFFFGSILLGVSGVLKHLTHIIVY